jgi:hypothetical protein
VTRNLKFTLVSAKVMAKPLLAKEKLSTNLKLITLENYQ